MDFRKNDVMVDLGTGQFRVSRFVKTLVNRLSELPTANGDIDRVFTGYDVTYLLEGEYDAAIETEFFEELLGKLECKRIAGAEIDGRECPELAAVKLSLTRTDDSFLGRYTIMLKEL